MMRHADMDFVCVRMAVMPEKNPATDVGFTVTLSNPFKKMY